MSIRLSGDFFVFGGLYRKVSLVVTDPVHVDMMDFGGPGLYAHASSIDAERRGRRLSGGWNNDGGHVSEDVRAPKP